MSIKVLKFEELQEDCLDRVSDVVDKREGSMIYDAVGPCMWEHYGLYEAVNNYHDNTYPGTASRSGLIAIAEEQGVTPHPATCSVVKGVFTPTTLELAIGARFNREDVNFAVTEKLEPGVYSLTCETVGASGNATPGLMTPVDNITGLETAELVDVLVYGEDEEDTEVFRARYFDGIRNHAQDGNVAQYKQWADEFPGVGGNKITPGWNGRCTVKVAILDSQNGVASDKLIGDFQAVLDPANDVINDNTSATNYPQGRGLGNGKAPIGAIVTVVTATERPVNVSAKITMAPGYASTDVIDQALEEYFIGQGFSKSAISYMGVGAAILMCPAVDGIADLRVNGGMSDITLGDEEVPGLGTTNWTVI